MDKIKKAFGNAISKNGSYSVGLIVLVICIAVVCNLIIGQLPESVKKIDISSNKIYEISDTSRKLLKKLDQKVKFTVFAEESSTDERIRTFLDKYTDLSDQIEVEWVDPVLHPAELTENNVESDNILISCEDTGKSTVVAFSDIIVSDAYSYYTTGSATESEFDGEGQFTSAVNYVTSDATKKIYYTTGHGEKTFSSSVSQLLDKNNMSAEELNLIMENEIPSDCDLLYLYSPSKDITEDEKDRILSYMEEGGKVFLMLGDVEDEVPNLDAVLAAYGISRVEGYIADMQRCYQGNPYYIFPEISAYSDVAEGLSSNMVLLVNAHGLTVQEGEDDTISTTEFLSTSSDAYEVTEEDQKQGTYALGVIATKSIASDSEDEEEESIESRLTVISAESLIDSQITDSLSTLENLDLFMNAVSANFDDVENVAIEPKSLQVENNTMQHAGVISLFLIFGIPLIILVFGFAGWWKRRKA